jgi:Tol biopolymer transport system component
MSESTRRRATASLIASLSLVQLGCGAAGERAPTVVPPIVVPTIGKLVIVLEPRGNGRDADGFSAAIDGASTRTLTSDASVAYDSLSPGNHTVRIADIAPQCAASADSITRAVKVGATDTVTVGMTCLGGFAYLQDVDANTTDLFYLTEDGRTIQLTNGPGLKFIEAWSPDGTQLLYSQEQTNGWRIHTVRADGTDSRPLTSDVGNEFSPRWSPDGTHIAYQKGDSTGVYIAISDPDGANVHPLAGTSPVDFGPSWSADGSRLYFGCYRFQRIYDLCTAALDGSDLRPIRYAALDPIVTPCTPACTVVPIQFAASPDGLTIAIELAPGQGPVLERVWAASVDGTSAIPLSGNTISFAGRWSPSGDRMLLNISDGGTGYAMATVNTDGSSYRQIVSYADSISSGDWSPDGTVIAYNDLRTRQIGAMNADGSNRRPLTTGIGKGTPIWNPKARAVGTLSSDRVRVSAPNLEKTPILSRLRPEMLRRSLHPRP